LPETDPAVANANDFAHALRLSAEGFVAQEAMDVLGDFIWRYIKANQTIFRMTQVRFVKVVIAGEEGWASQAVQQRNDLVLIIHTLSANSNADLAAVNP
jgi:hypothetical protein